MLIGLVSAVLRRSLGRYVENIDNDKLSYSLYQGQVALNDLVLRPEALTHLLGLPIKLRSGTISRVLLQIPITQLRSQPWCITIEGVQLEISSEDDDDEQDDGSAGNSDAVETPEDKAARLWQAKKAYLDRLESRWWQIVQQGGMAGATAVASTGCPPDSSWWSYGVSLVYGIIRNLQVEIRDVHFSFVGEAALQESSASSPSVPFHWGVRLRQLSAQTTDESWDSSKRPTNGLIEYKAINIVDLSVYWLPNKSQDTTSGTSSPEAETQYLLPPSQFSIHLKRQTTPEPLTLDPRIEVEASLGQLKLQLSNSAYRLMCGFITYLNRRFSATRRPRVRPSQQPKAWWLYAAGEVVPALRSRLCSESGMPPVPDLSQLVTEATRAHNYVRAYEEHLVQGLCLTTGPQPDDENHWKIDLQAVEQSMPLERIILLRQLAMQRAAQRLCAYAMQHDGRMPALRPDMGPAAADMVPSSVPAPSAPASSASWWPQFLSSNNSLATGTTATSVAGKAATDASVPTSTNTTSWRLWWWWNTTPPSPEGGMKVSADAEAILEAPHDGVGAAAVAATPAATAHEVPPAEATEAALGLLNELVSTDDVAQVLFRDRLFCRATLLVCQCHFALTGNAVSDAEPLLSVTGESLHFGLETRPRHQSLRFTVGLRSLTIMDERRRWSIADPSHELRPLLPLVVVPQASATISDEKRGLFWLAYELNPPGLASTSSLKVRTDPLRIVYQPELFLQAVKFFQPGNLRSGRVAAANTYTAIMARTEANLRAVIKNADIEDELLAPELTKDAPESVKRPVLKESSQWLFDFDIAAPKILFTDRLWPTSSSSRAEKASVLGVLCDFGHFHLSNKAMEDSKESNLLETKSTTPRAKISFDEERTDEEDDFATPCGSPEPSDNENGDEKDNEKELTITQTNANRRRSSQVSSRPKKLYETYTLRLDDLCVLTGRMGDLQKSGLWAEVDDSGATLDSSHSRRTADHTVTSPAMSRVHLIDRFSLTAWIAKRVLPMAVISPLKGDARRWILPPGIPPDLPGLLVSWEQHQCVLRLSDAKVDALRQCVSAAVSYSLSAAEDSGTLTPVVSVAPAATAVAAAQLVRFTSLRRTRQQEPQEGVPHRSQSTLRRPRHRHHPASPSMSSSSSITPPLSLPQPVLRRRILITFRMQELILQMDSNDRPLAECRLTSTTAAFARFTGVIDHGLVEYQARAQVHSLTIADAVSGLGGDFDLLAASHRGVRMDTLSGHLKLISEPEKLSQPQNARQGKMTPVSVPVLPPFFDPFAETEDTTTTLIRVLYTVTRPPLDDPLRVTERRLDVKFSCLDLLGNQQTLCELITFFRRIVPTESTPRSRSASRSTDEVPGDHFDPTPSPAHATAAESAISSRPHTLDVLVSVERLSLVLVRVPQHRWPRRPEYLATATLLGANFDWHHDSSDTYNVSLEGMQVLDLSPSSGSHRHIFAAGSCLDPELGQSLPLTHLPPQAHVLKVACQRRHRHPVQPANSPAAPAYVDLTLHIEIANPVYVHKPQALQDIRAWFSSLPQIATHVARRLKQRLQSAAGRVARKVVLEEDSGQAAAATTTAAVKALISPRSTESSGGGSGSAFHFTSFQLSLAQPVLVLPQSSTSPLVLVGRLGHLRMVSDVVATRPVIRMSIERASLTSLDVGALPSVWGTSEAVRAMLELAHFRGLVKSNSEFQVLEDISSNLMLSKCKAILPKSTVSCSIPINWPMDFDAESPKIPFIDTEDDSPPTPEVLASVADNSSREVTWLMVEACLTQPLHVRLTKKVYQQVLQSLDNLVAEDTPDYEEVVEDAEVDKAPLDDLTEEEEEEDNGEPPLSAILGLRNNFQSEASEDKVDEASATPKWRLPEKVPFLAMQFRMPLLVVETFAQLDIDPVGLVRLTLTDFFISVSQSSGGLRRVSAHLASLNLKNLLPDIPSQGNTKENDQSQRYLLFSQNQTASPSKPTGSRIVPPRRKCRYQKGLGWMVADSCPDLLSLLASESVGCEQPVPSTRFRYNPTASWTLKGVAKSLQKTGPHALWLTERCHTEEDEKGHVRRRSSASSLLSLTAESKKEPCVAKAQASVTPQACQQFVRIRVLFVDPKRLNFPTKYNSQKRFIDVAFSSLTCRLSLHPWVLLLDFLGFESPLSACDDFNRAPRADTSASPTLNSPGDALEGLSPTSRGLQEEAVETEDEETEDNTVLSLSVTSFTLLLTVAPCATATSKDTWELAKRPHETDFLRLSASSLLLDLVSHSRTVLHGGNWMTLDGRLGEVMVEDLSPSGRLYPQRFVTAPSSWQESATTATPASQTCNSSSLQKCLLTFSLKRHTLPDPQLTRREEEAILSVRLAPAYYVHTHAFLTTVTDTLERFLQYQDLMNRVSASSKGLKVRSVPPLSSRIRLDIDAHSPIIVLPVCSESERVLVCDLGHLTAVNSFVWNGDEGSLSFADLQEAGECGDGGCGQTPVPFERQETTTSSSAPMEHIMPRRNLQDCPHCMQASHHSSSKVRKHELSPGVDLPKDQSTPMPASIAPKRVKTTPTEASDALYTRCLLDCIDLNLTDIQIYVGRRRSQAPNRRPETSEEEGGANTDRTLCFRDFYISPLERTVAAADAHSQPRRRLTDPFELRVRVERNLSTSRCRLAPDWRLSAKLQLLAVHVELADYTLLRGVLAHNLSEGSPTQPAPEVAAAAATLKRSTIARATPDTQPSCTQRPWRVFAFKFDLQDVSIHFAVPPDWPSLRARPTDGVGGCVNFCRLDFIRSQLVYEKFSDDRHNTELSCSAVNFGDTRFDDLAESPPNLFTTILTSINPTEDLTSAQHQSQLPQFRITNVENPNHSCMTYYLRSMRLILAFDWICDLHRFLTTPPDSAFQLDHPTGMNNASVEFVSSLPDTSKPASPETSELRLYADQSEFVLLENPSDAETNAVILAGAACFFLRRSTTPEEWIARAPDGRLPARQNTNSKRLGLRLHGVSVHTRSFSDPDSSSADVIVEPADVDIQLGPAAPASSSSPSSSRSTTGAAGQEMAGGLGAAHSFRSTGLQELLTPRCVLKISTSSIRTHFSYTDSQLFLALLSSFQEQASSAFAPTGADDDDGQPTRPTPSSTDMDESIARLMEMGFSWEQASMQTKVLQGDPQSALLNLMLPPGPDLGNRQPPQDKRSPPSSMAVRRLKQIFDFFSPSVSVLHFKSNFSLCLIDDCLDADVPLAEIILSDIAAKWCLTGWAVGRGKARLAVNYYNRDLSALEPAVEPFLCILDWRLSSDHENGELSVFEIHSPETVNINLTVPLVRLTRLVMEKTRQERAAILEASKNAPASRTARRRVPFVPFRLSNQTGSILWFKALTEGSAADAGVGLGTSFERGAEWLPVAPYAPPVDLPFRSAMAATPRCGGRPRSRMTKQRQTSPRLILLVNGWQPTYPVAVDRLGIFFRTIKLVATNSTETSDLSAVRLPPCSTFTRLVIEVVRRGSAQNLIIVRSGLTVTNRLSSDYALEVGLDPNHQQQLPSTRTRGGPAPPPKGAGPRGVIPALRVPFGETAAVPLDLAARASLGFGRFCVRPVCVGAAAARTSSHFSWSELVVSRRPPPQSEHQQSDDSRGQEHYARKDALNWLSLTKPGDFSECVVMCRRLTSGSQLGLLLATGADSTAVTPGLRCVATEQQPQMGANLDGSHQQWQLCVTLVRDAFPPDPLLARGQEAALVLPGHHFTVGPALRIANLLPCEMVYFLEGCPIRGRISPNSTASVFEVGCADTLRFGVHLDGFERCEPLIIPPSTVSHQVLMRLADADRRTLELQVKVSSRAFGARHLTVSAVCWLINHSGLPLVFAQTTPSSLVTANELRPSTAAYRLLAAGQSVEQEFARLASPLLFSFPNKEDNERLQVRVGVKYDPTGGQVDNGADHWTPRWSPSIDLSKTGVDLLRLRLQSMEDRPDLLYSIGVEVRKGRGPHSVTTMVTFTPRFVISNETNLRLQFAQRFCLESVTLKSAVMDTQPHCSLSFHWPRQDLDQLLCVRALVSDVFNCTSKDAYEATHWSGGMQIDMPRSYSLKLRLPRRSASSASTAALLTGGSVPDALFLRVSIVLRSATFFIIVTDASRLPPLYRIENRSLVSLFYFQAIGGVPGDEMSAAELPQSSWQTGKNGHWSGGVAQCTLHPRSGVNYAPDEPLLPALLSVGVQGGLSRTYDFDKLGPGPQLVYENYAYLTTCGAADDSASLSSMASFEYPVLDVTPRSKRVVLNLKRPGERSQLWYLSDTGHILHEGSSVPCEPSSRERQHLSKRSWVLDVDTGTPAADAIRNHVPSIDSTTLENFEIGILCLAPFSRRRANYQVWHLDERGFLVNDASFCVQAARELEYRTLQSSCSSLQCLLGGSILVARPRRDARCLVSKTLSAAKIMTAWLRPGSGCLDVEVIADGPVKVLVISDHYEEPLPTTSLQSIRSRLSSSTLDTNRTINPTSLKVLLDFPSGLGISIVSGFSEELCYASFIGLRLSLDRIYPGTDIVPRSARADNRASNGGDFEYGEDLTKTLDDAVFVDDAPAEASVVGKPPLPRLRIRSLEDTFSADARSPMEQVRLHIHRIQVDSQFPGATLPILLFRSVPSAQNASSASCQTRGAIAPAGGRSVVQGRPMHHDLTWIRARELFRLLEAADRLVEEETLFAAADRDTQWLAPVLVQRHVRLLNTGWEAQIFTLLEVNLNKLIIQAEETLLLKLIQFGRNFYNGVQPLQTNFEDARYLDLIATRPSLFMGEVEGTYARQLSPPAVQALDCFYFGRLRIFIAPMRVTVQTAKGKLGPEFHDVKRLLPKLMSFADAELRLEPLDRHHFLECGPYLLDQLLMHYQLQLRAQALKIFGSVDFLGNPLGFINDLSAGISGLVEMDVGGLVRNVFHGVGDSTAKVVGSMSQLVHAMSLDERHQRQRSAILDSQDDNTSQLREGGDVSEGMHQTNSHASGLSEVFEDYELIDTVPSMATNSDDGRQITAPLAAGFRGFVHGVFGGVTSMVTQPYHGVREDNFKGFVYGVGRGLLGTVAKPVGGVLDLVSGAMTTLREAARSSSYGRPRRRRPRRSGLSPHRLPLLTYSLAAAVCQLQLRRLAASLPDDRFHSTTPVVPPPVTETAEVETGEDAASVYDPTIQRPAARSAPPRQALSALLAFTSSSMQSPHLIEGDPSEAVIHVLPCQSWAVSVLVTDRALWCIRKESQGGAGQQETTSLMFVIPYRRLDCVRILDKTEAALALSRKLAGPGQATSFSSIPAKSTYVEFMGDGRNKRRLLRFDRQEWALDVLNELNEAHFRFVQTAMTLSRKAQDETDELCGHPLAMAFAPPLSIMDKPLDSSQSTPSSPLPDDPVLRP